MNNNNIIIIIFNLKPLSLLISINILIIDIYNNLLIRYYIGKIWYPFNSLNGWWLTQLARSWGYLATWPTSLCRVFLTRSLRAAYAQPARNLPVIYAFGNYNYIYLFYTNNIF